jgi:hypothetical protein
MKKNYNRLAEFALLGGILGFMLAVWPTVAPGQDSTGQPRQEPLGQDPWVVFKVIVERNMFSRQRGVRVERPDRNDGGTQTPPPAPNPESYYLLKGIVQEDGAFMAFVEDKRSGDILRLHEGDAVARGSIKSLNLDSLEYELEQRIVVVTMGHDLEGGQGTVTMADLLDGLQGSSSLTTAERQGGSPAPQPTGAEADILKQLMERRQQQLGQ